MEWSNCFNGTSAVVARASIAINALSLDPPILGMNNVRYRQARYSLRQSPLVRASASNISVRSKALAYWPRRWSESTADQRGSVVPEVLLTTSCLERQVMKSGTSVSRSNEVRTRRMRVVFGDKGPSRPPIANVVPHFAVRSSHDGTPRPVDLLATSLRCP